jgi:DNA-binding transcriptional ArsR family regulator
VDNEIRNLTIIVDPYNEIYESVEYNNVITFDNPFYQPDNGGETTDQGSSGDDGGSDTGVENPTDSNNPTGDDGGIIWEENTEKIPQKSDDESIGPVIPNPPDGEKTNPIPPAVIPMVGFVLTTTILGMAWAGIKLEFIRYKLLLLIIPLYSKLKKKDIEQGVRYEIMGYLKAKPGANYTELKNNLDLHDGSLVHHLGILEREEKIYSKKVGKYKLFYISAYRRQPTIGTYLSPFQQRILEIISRNPGIVPKTLSKMLDRSQTDMSYHLSELTRSGFLEKKKRGRNTHYYLVEV